MQGYAKGPLTANVRAEGGEVEARRSHGDALAPPDVVAQWGLALAENAKNRGRQRGLLDNTIGRRSSSPTSPTGCKAARGHRQRSRGFGKSLPAAEALMDYVWQQREKALRGRCPGSMPLLNPGPSLSQYMAQKLTRDPSLGEPGYEAGRPSGRPARVMDYPWSSLLLPARADASGRCTTWPPRRRRTSGSGSAGPCWSRRAG